MPPIWQDMSENAEAVIIALGGAGDPKSYAHDLESLHDDALATMALFSRGAGRFAALAAPLAALRWRPEQRYEETRADIDSFQTSLDTARDSGISLLFALTLDGLLEEVLW